MRKLLIILTLIPVLGFSQPYGNEWINFSQDYFMVKVLENGIYKVSYGDLVNAGFNASSIDPRNIQMYRRGVEVAIHVEGENDGSFDPTDYLLFYGQRNDGQLDQELYVSPDAQPHQYAALYADSATYFITSSISEIGKRMDTLPVFTGPTPDSSVENQIIQVLTNDYAQGIIDGENTRLTQFDYGEGFTGPRATEATNRHNQDIYLTGIDFPDITATNPIIELVVVGRNNEIHNYEVLVGPDETDLVSLGTYQITAFNHQNVVRNIDWSRISGSGQLLIRVAVINDGGAQSNISISSAKIDYARLTDVNNLDHLEVTTNIKQVGGNTLNFINVPIQSLVFDISDPANVRKVDDGNVDPARIDIGFITASTSRNLAISVPAAEFSIRKADFKQIDPTNYNYLIISHPMIMQAAGGYDNVVQAYADYRMSAVGGSFDVLIEDINMLYNQFSYGQPTPVAIYRFMRYMYDLGEPQHLFLLGKGLDVSKKFHKSTNWVGDYSDYVPTGGTPGSDLVYSVGLGAILNAPAVPVGRLSVTNPLEVANYLDKVKEMESLSYDALWRKNVLHLSGGNDLNEINLFKNYLNDLAEIAKGPYFGGDVSVISKKTTNPIEKINVSSEVNEGVNIITFFGHSSPLTSDIDIGKVSDPNNNYNNPGKYPLILMNGCSTGNIYDSTFLFTEDWIATGKKGATGIIAHSSYGIPSILKYWSSNFYSLAYGDSVFIEKSIGDILIETGNRVLAPFGTNPNIVIKTQVQQMGLQGDPAMKLFGTYIPDFEVTSENVEIKSVDNNIITAELDSFTVEMAIPNFGAYINDSLKVAIQRELPGGTIGSSDTLLFPPVRYLDTLQISIDNRSTKSLGNNKVKIFLDPLNEIIEHNPFNNYAEVDFQVLTSGTYNVSPYNYSLDSQKSVDLKIHPGNPLMDSRSYLIEIDTAADFSSGLISRPPVTGQQLLIEQVDLLDEDTAVYYWRSKYEFPEANESEEWAVSSFSVIDGASPGWAQLDYFQQIENRLSGLKRNDSSEEFSFLNSEVTLDIRVPGNHADTIFYDEPSTIVRDAQITIDGVNYLIIVDGLQGYNYCYNNRLNIVAFDKETSLPYSAIYGKQTDEWTCGKSPQIINSYNGGETLDDIVDAIHAGDKVVLFTIGNFDFNSLSTTTIDKLEELGADASVLLNKSPGEPYILVGYKGAGSGNSITEIVADPSSSIPVDEQTITYTGVIAGTYSKGSMSSPRIGPSDDWQTLYLDVKSQDADDDYRLDILGYNLEGQSSLLFNDIKSQMLDISSINPIDYPYIGLELSLEDTVNLTAPQLDKWIINYEPVVEGYLSFDSLNETTSTAIELQEGEELKVVMSFTNISEKTYNVDKLLVEYSTFNKETRRRDTASLSIEAPSPGVTTRFSIPINTKGLGGTNDLDVFVNPMIEPELLYTNNNISIPDFLTVMRDNTNPVLDVSFDGEYIFDGDIVSPNPNISIQIRDDNPYLQKADTTGIDVLLKRPCDGCISERIPLSGNSIVWRPEDDKEPFQIDFTPMDLENGIYELQVKVADASGNQSGVEPYKINFEVINESTVTNFYPYPNPFSTSVKFIFTLTGNEVPDEIMIRIMTVSGRVVKEIMQEELGPLKIGNNVTDYAWNGHDEFGDQLANGVYLYKVFLRKNGQNIELRPSAGDRGFKNGYGKLYLLR